MVSYDDRIERLFPPDEGLQVGLVVDQDRRSVTAVWTPQCEDSLNVRGEKLPLPGMRQYAFLKQLGMYLAIKTFDDPSYTPRLVAGQFALSGEVIVGDTLKAHASLLGDLGSFTLWADLYRTGYEIGSKPSFETSPETDSERVCDVQFDIYMTPKLESDI